MDVLVVLSDASGAERARAIDAGGMIGLERDLVMAPLVLTESEWNELLRSERRLGREIERDGVAGVTRENRIANARAEIGSARDAVRVAEAALAIDVRRDAMSRAYYAVFHAARALLLLEGAEPKTHGGVSRMIGEQLVRAGKMDSKSALLVTRLQAYRQASDYSYAFAIDLDDARNELAHVRAFVEHAALAVEAAGGE